MKTIVSYILISILFTGTLSAQSVHWQWARTSASPALTEGVAAAIDKKGDIYTVAGFYDSVIFASQSVHSALGPAMTQRTGACAVAKYTPTGALLSLKTPSLPMSLWHIEVDDQGYLYGAGELKTDTVQFRGVACLAKYDTSMQVVWIDTPSSANPNRLSQTYNMAMDASGYLYTVGVFFDTLLSFGPHVLHSHSRNGTFMTRYASDGTPLWATNIDPDTATSANVDCVAPDLSGHVYYGGVYLGSDSVRIGTTTLRGMYPQTLLGFVTQYDTAGHMIWAIGLQSSGTTVSNSNLTVQHIRTDQSGNVYVAGTYSGRSIIVGNMTIQAAGGEGAMFIAKISASGQPLWIKASSRGRTNGATSPDIAISSKGLIYGTAGVSEAEIWDGHLLGTDQGNSQDLSFVITLDLDGNFQCGQMLPYGGDDGSHLVTDTSGDAYIIGDYMDSTFTLGTDTMAPKPYGYENVFTARFDCPGSLTGISPLSGDHSLSVHPNPITDAAIVTYALPAGTTDAYIAVYDVPGRERHIYSVSPASAQISIPARDMGSGMYFCTLIAQGKAIATVKMIVE